MKKECILRADNGECDRDCANCDLLMDSKDILKTFNTILDLLSKEPNNRLLDATINKYSEKVKIYNRNATSKEYYNVNAAEHDRQIAKDYQQLVCWLKELKAYRIKSGGTTYDMEQK